jgi:pyrrolidone-carboxylate peptidase
MEKTIKELVRILEKGDKIKTETIEENIAESIEEAIKEELFFSLPTNEIIKIIQKSDISNAKTYFIIISRMCEVKGGEAAIILNAVESKEATLEECIKIVSSLKCSPICVRLGELFTENEMQPEIDYEHEIFKLKKEIEELKQQKRTIFRPVTKKPFDFVKNIHKAASEGKLTSVQYLIEHCNVNVEVRDNNFGSTPLHFASINDQIEIVTYLIEHCHANVEAKDNDGCTPLHNSSMDGHIGIVKYLCEQCNADVETKSKNGMTPLHVASVEGRIEVVKYLIEQCHANVEAKSKNGMTPLHVASVGGRIEVVKYLVEQCYANIEAIDNDGKTPLDVVIPWKGTKEYLHSLV